MIYKNYTINSIKGDTTNNWVRLSNSTVCNVTEEVAMELIDLDILNKEKINELKEWNLKAMEEFYNKK